MGAEFCTPLSTTFQRLRQEREAMEGRVERPIAAAFQGSYRENGRTVGTSYNLNIDNKGYLSGTTVDENGPGTVNGVVEWPDTRTTGSIAWLESRPSIEVEMSGEISYDSSKRQMSIRVT